MSKLRFVGLDVHAETIVAAVAEERLNGEVRSMGTIPNRLESIRKLMAKLGPATNLRVCYEAGPTGYVLYWQLTQMGIACQVIAPSLIPTKAGDRVKTESPRCGKAGAQPPGRRTDGGMGARCRPRSPARPGASPGSGQERSIEGAAPAG